MAERDCSGWWSGGVTCAVCGFEWVGVWCDCADRRALECRACGALAGMPEPKGATHE
jgi:hypothetical protein